MRCKAVERQRIVKIALLRKVRESHRSTNVLNLWGDHIARQGFIQIGKPVVSRSAGVGGETAGPASHAQVFGRRLSGSFHEGRTLTDLPAPGVIDGITADPGERNGGTPH